MKPFKLLLSSKACISVLLPWLLWWHGNAHAYEPIKNLQVSPFLSQAGIYTSDNNFHGNSDDDISFSSNELGAVFNYKVIEALNLSAQLMMRNAGEMDNGNLRADYLFAQLHLLDSFDNSLAIKAGKLRLPYGFYNDTRDVASTNPSIILPQGIYIDRGRNTFYAANGVVLHGSNYLGDVSLNWDLGSVRIEPDDDEMDDLAGFPAEKNAKGNFAPIARIIAGFNNDQLRLGYSYRKSEFEFTPKDISTARFNPGTLETRSRMISFQYLAEKWTITAEWSRADTDANLNLSEVFINPPGAWVPFTQAITVTFPAESYYLQAEYRLNAKFKLLARRDEIYANRNDRHGTQLANSPELQMFPEFQRPAYSQYAQDNVLGITWNISPSMLARAEWHNVEGAFWLSGQDNPDTFDTQKFWNMVAVQFAYRF